MQPCRARLRLGLRGALALDAVLKAVRNRKPRGAKIHSDQGIRFGSDAWRRFCKSNSLGKRLKASAFVKGWWK
jgi:transposase InsO family protein